MFRIRKISNPYFSGFSNERGEGEGLGFNKNYPLPEKITYEIYHEYLLKAAERIKKFSPEFLVVSIGFDTSKGDPTGTWPLVAKDFYQNGQIIASMGIPTLFVQEGGYKTQSLGKNAKAFFLGFYDALK